MPSEDPSSQVAHVLEWGQVSLRLTQVAHCIKMWHEQRQKMAQTQHISMG